MEIEPCRRLGRLVMQQIANLYTCENR